MIGATIPVPLRPTLLLSPGESRDRNGAVSPSLGSGVVVDGDNWVLTNTGGVVYDMSATWGDFTVLFRQDTEAIPANSGATITLNRTGLWNQANYDSSAVQIINTDMMRSVARYGDLGQVTVADAIRRPGLQTFVVRQSGDSITMGFHDDLKSINEPQLYGQSTARVQAGVLGHAGLVVQSILVFDTLLTDDEIRYLSEMPSVWTWDSATIMRPQDVQVAIPGYSSGIADLKPTVYITDRNNEAREDIGDALLSVQPDWDIDRAGSKGRVAIETHQGVLQPGMWIAPYVTITPEVGDIVHQQMGHFRLGRPGEIANGTVDYDGMPSRLQHAAGSDIIDDIAAVKLRESFYTPVFGTIMNDIYVLLKMATCGLMGPNILTNGSFESEGSGWSGPSFEAGATGSFMWGRYPSVPYADGTKMWTATFNAGSPVGGQAWVGRQENVPAGARYLYFSGLSWRGAAGLECFLRILFRDENGTEISGSRTESPKRPPTNRWHRHFMVVEVPVGAVTFSAYAFNATAQSSGSASVASWDDLRVGTCSMQPIPDSQINLPPSTVGATTRIQTMQGQSIGYDGINADRAAAIGHHALYTQQNSQIATSPLRDLATAVPARTYGPGDIRLVGEVETQATTGDQPNHFMAIKEDFMNPANSLYADTFNNRAADPFSVVNTGRVVSAEPIMVPDAVDKEALYQIAIDAKNRASTQETVRFQLLPDPALSVYDVVEMTDPATPAALGRWMIESIAPSMDPRNSMVEVSARRSIGEG